MKSSSPSVGIVGGGVLGMTLSLRLAEAGLNVTLFESSEALGGVASSCRIGDYVWDRFYHVILMSDSHLLDLIGELGLKDELIWGITKTGFYADGKLYSVSNAIEYLLFPPLNIRDKLRLGWTILYASRIKNWKRLETISSADWLVRHSGRRTFDKLWLPLLKSKLGGDYRLASAAFIWAHIARLYAARRSGLKKEMFGYIKGGYRTFIEALRLRLEEKGVSILQGTRVSMVREDGSGVLIETGKGTALRVDKAVLTVPCPQVLELCPQLTPQEKSRLRSVVYQDLICAVFLLKTPLSGFYTTNIAADSIPFTGVIEMTALVDKAHFGGHSLVYLPRYMTKADPFVNESNEAIKDRFFSSLRAIHPELAAEELVAYHISRISDFPFIPTLHYQEKSLPASNTSLKRVFVVNSAQIVNGTNNINESVRLANKKAAALTPLLI